MANEDLYWNWNGMDLPKNTPTQNYDMGGINPWSGTIWDLEGFNEEPTHKVRTFSERWQDMLERYEAYKKQRLIDDPNQGRFPGRGNY